jgi:hypothetical protein
MNGKPMLLKYRLYTPNPTFPVAESSDSISLFFGLTSCTVSLFFDPDRLKLLRKLEMI